MNRCGKGVKSAGGESSMPEKMALTAEVPMELSTGGGQKGPTKPDTPRQKSPMTRRVVVTSVR